MLPVIRTKPRGTSLRNQSLQDILSTSKPAEKVLVVKPHIGGIHNTKLVLLMSNGDQRVCFYDRLAYEDVVADLNKVTGGLNDVINLLNLQGCDFTEDDLELVGGVLRAKDTSLGYYNKNTVVPVACHCVLDNLTLDYSLNPLPSQIMVGHTKGELVIDEYTIDLIIHGVTYTLKTPPSKENVVVDWIGTVISTNQLQNQISIDFLVNGSLRVKNLKAECGSFGLIVTAAGNRSVTSLGSDGNFFQNIPPFNEVYEKIHVVELCAKDQRKLVCAGLGNKIGFQQEVARILRFPEGTFTLQLNELMLKDKLPVTPLMTSLEDVIGTIVRSEVSRGYFNMVGTSGTYHRLLYNSTKDCLRIKLSFKPTGFEEDFIFFDHVLGTDEMGTVDGVIENMSPFIVELVNNAQY